MAHGKELCKSLEGLLPLSAACCQWCVLQEWQLPFPELLPSPGQELVFDLESGSRLMAILLLYERLPMVN